MGLPHPRRYRETRKTDVIASTDRGVDCHKSDRTLENESLAGNDALRSARFIVVFAQRASVLERLLP